MCFACPNTNASPRSTPQRRSSVHRSLRNDFFKKYSTMDDSSEKFWLCPSPSSWGPPVNSSCAFRCRRLVSATLAFCVCDICVLSGTKSGPKDGTIPLGSLAHNCQLPVMALLGAAPLVGRSLTSRYQGPPKRLSRGAGRPMGPSTPRVCHL